MFSENAFKEKTDFLAHTHVRYDFLGVPYLMTVYVGFILYILKYQIIEVGILAFLLLEY